MKHTEILLFGASGQIGRHLIRRLTRNNYKITAVTRNYHQKGYLLKTQANPGYLNVVEANIFDVAKLNELVSNSNIVINLVGILSEKKNNTFQNIHTIFPDILSGICKKNNIDQFIHLSALGIEKANDSKYAKSKMDGEALIVKNYKKSIILKPSLVYSVDDNFTTKFMTLLNLMPFFPLYYNGQTKFAPIHVTDMAEIIFQIVNKKINSEIIECVGPNILTFKEIIEKLLKSIDKKRLLLPIPLSFARLAAYSFEILMRNPLMTNDQLKLLRYDNIPSGLFKINENFNFIAEKKFDVEIEKYSYMWKENGEYAKNLEKEKIKK